MGDEQEAAALKCDSHRKRDAPSTTEGISLSSARYEAVLVPWSAVIEVVEAHLMG
jgi:hypothetical protein